VVLAAGRARAQDAEFGDLGHVAISAERLFGYVHTSETTTVAGVDTSRSNDSFSLFSNPFGGIATGYGWPRLAVDVFAARGLSVGAAAGFFHVSTNNTSLNGFLLAPRIGYATNLGGRAFFWPRGGMTYAHASSSAGSGALTSTGSVFALTLEAPLAIVATPHVAFLVGPTFDLGLSGSTTTGGAKVDSKTTDFGVQAGLLAYF
jgi:hypothetical protein